MSPPEEIDQLESRKLWVGAIFLFVLGDALTLQTRGALLPSFQSSFGVSESMLSLVAPAGMVGFVLAVLAIGFMAGRIDAKRALVVGVGLTGVFLLLASGAGIYWLFLLFVAGQGTATGAVRALDRPILGHLYPDSLGRVFVLHSLAWAAGAVAGPLYINAVLSQTGWRVSYLLLGLFFLPLVTLLWKLELPGDVRDERKLSLSGLGRLIRRPAIWGMAVAMTLAGGIEGIIFTWLPYYVASFSTPELGNVLLSMYLVAYIPGRIVYSLMTDRVPLIDIVILTSACALPALYLAFGGLEGWMLFGAVFVAGLFISGYFPIVSAFGVDTAPEYSGPVNAIAVAGTYGGIAIGPVVVGVLAELTDIETAMTVPVSLLAVLLVVLVAIRFTST